MSGYPWAKYDQLNVRSGVSTNSYPPSYLLSLSNNQNMTGDTTICPHTSNIVSSSASICKVSVGVSQGGIWETFLFIFYLDSNLYHNTSTYIISLSRNLQILWRDWQYSQWEILQCECMISVMNRITMNSHIYISLWPGSDISEMRCFPIIFRKYFLNSTITSHNIPGGISQN